VSSVVDTTSIKVGEQFSYKIIIESDNFQEINFPETFNFSPFTIADQFPSDTNYLKSKKIISKKFNLTHFDEGSYSISPQKLSIGKEIYSTEKIDIDVITIKVDTVSKKFFDIKEIKFTDDPNSSIFKIITPLALFILGCLVLFFIYRSYKKLKSKEFFFQTPFEKAVLSLQEIEKSKLDNQKDLKEFYTRLIEIVKRYFEDDSIDPNAMESTSNQLISKLKLLKTSKKINLSENTINSLAEVLGNSDLVKFARLEMDQNTITSDQIKIKEIISSAKKSIPNNEQRDNEKRKEEELKFQKKLKNKKIRYIVSSALTVILTILAIVIFLFGAPKSIDSLSLNSDKKLLNQDWVESVYTEFNLRLQTPDALVRSSDSLSNDLNGSLGFDFESSNSEDLDVRLTYALFDSNFNLLDQKDSIVNRVYIPQKFSLNQNYPNPFNPKTTIRFSLPNDSNVELFVYDVNGKIVKEFINTSMQPGNYKVVWDGTNQSGVLVGSGIYFYRIKAGSFIASQKMIFLK